MFSEHLNWFYCGLLFRDFLHFKTKEGTMGAGKKGGLSENGHIGNGHI
jgi:hypothetical protein